LLKKRYPDLITEEINLSTDEDSKNSVFSEKNFTNKITAIKNNKLVYMNSNIKNKKKENKDNKNNLNNTSNNNNNNSTENIFQQKKNIKFINRGLRGSKYRGVSKNGNQWQVLIMLNKSKSYVGTFPSEYIAARIYDMIALQNRGEKAKTNFLYNNEEMKKLCSLNIKQKDLQEKINEIFIKN